MKLALVFLAGLLSAEVAALRHRFDAAADLQYVGDAKKPVMDAITVMRMEMCWGQADLMHHEECLKFLGVQCLAASTDKGICEKFHTKVEDACLEDPTEEALSKESEEALQMHKLRCQIAKDLGSELAEEHVDDHAGADSDGDGVPDVDDAFPADPHETADIDGDGIGDNADPDDSTKLLDSDGDGIGDDADHYPSNPDCHTDPCVLADGSLAPAAALAPAPGPGPAHPLHPSLRGGGELMPRAAPWMLSKVPRNLPEQGFDEHSHGIVADHQDGKTVNADWGHEFHWRGDDEETIKRICAESPDNDWCKHRLQGDYSGWKWPFHTHN